MLATAFLIGGVYCLTRNRKSILNVFSFLVLLSLGWWNFCNAFFFSSVLESDAWRWHHLAALGWTGFIAETTYYFIVLTGVHEKMRKFWMQLAFYAFPAVLLIHNLFGETTSLAEGFVKSALGNQWTYVNSPRNMWLWLYLVCLVWYFGFSFYLLLRWSSSVKHRLKKRLAVGFVVLDALTILLGFITDVLLPLFGRSVPAIANLCTALFGAGYFFIIIRYDLFNLHLVVPDRDIIEHGMGAVLVTDEEGEVLYCNPAGVELLETEKSRLVGGMLSEYFSLGQYKTRIQKPLKTADMLNDTELVLKAQSKKQKRLLVSAAVIRDRTREYLGTVVSMSDITQLSQLKQQYKIQSDRYEALAFVDTLTGLPNRRKTFEVLSEHAAAYAVNQTDYFLLYMDMDHFKSINDLYGHHVGDQFLIETANRLNKCVFGDIYFLGRLSGDELLMIGGPDTSLKVISTCVQRIQKIFETGFMIDKYHIQNSISIGYARYSDFKDVDAMVHQADAQMYMVKQARRSTARQSAEKR